MSGNSDCSVCQDSFENPKLLHCGHTFCCKCINIGLESSRRQDEIKCPLCRKVTKCTLQKGQGLMDNFFVSDRQYLSRIVPCAECKDITQNTACEYCFVYFCESCISYHMKNKCGRLDSQLQTDEPQADSDERFDDVDLEGRLISDHIPTKFYFELDGKIVIPNEFSDDNAGSININLSVIHCLSGDRIMVAPNGGCLILIYNGKGEEILRQALNINVIGITNGLTGCPILIQNGENGIYEYSYGTLNRKFGTQLHVPRAVSSLNNGRIVTVGVKLTHTMYGIHQTSNSALCIFENNGQLVKEVSEVDGEHILLKPTCVSVNLKNNDIFVGDMKKKQVIRFREDGNCVSFYNKPDIPEMEFSDDLTSENVNCMAMFPLSLAYNQSNDLLFASYHSPLGSGIHVLSPSLQLLGLFYSMDDLGIPAGLSCDDKGKLCAGGAVDGIIRVFNLSQFMNKI